MELPKKHLLNVAGVVINPATEDGNLADIKTQTDKLAFTGDSLKVTSTPGGTQDVNVTNTPDVHVTNTPNVSVSNFPVTQAISGSVSVSNLPVTQPVSGSVSVSNFPVTQPVSGTVTVQDGGGSVTIDGSVSVANFPASQAVTGTFWQATQPVSGSVAVSNLPIESVSTSAVTPITVSTTVATLLAARAERILAVIFNETGTLFVKAGTGASASSFTWRLTANTELDITDYTGIVTAVKATGTSTCLVTDF